MVYQHGVKCEHLEIGSTQQLNDVSYQIIRIFLEDSDKFSEDGKNRNWKTKVR